MLRSHTCGELTTADIGSEATLCGWVSTKRSHGGVIFIDLRDRYGVTQVVFEPSRDAAQAERAEKLPRESTVRVVGTVRARPEGMTNEKLATGSVELEVSELEVYSESKPLAIEPDDEHEANDEARLKYRFIDLRKPRMQRNIIERARIIQATHRYYDREGFTYVETPLFMRTTPEGARDFLVPSRLQPGSFYALPQSPQLYKQTLMVAGFDKYYQITKCLRDEDLRADRQPEFTQIDVEMSFAEEEDVMTMAEGLIAYIGKEVFGRDIATPFPRMDYREALETYGSDKPDLRYELPITNVSEIVKDSEFKVFTSIVSSGGSVRALCVKNPGFTRKDIDELIAFSQQNKAKGLAWMRVTDAGLESNIVKFFSEEQQQALVSETRAEAGDVLLFAADQEPTVFEILDKLRRHLADRLGLYDPDEWKFLWVTSFPLVEWNSDEKRWDAMHHPFTSPILSELKLLETDIGKARSRAYDVTMNGWEIGGGSIRIHDPKVQTRVFEALGLDDETIERKFGWFLEVLKYGVPPHGGIAFGFDRMVALMLGEDQIREVIPFPKNKAGQNPMDGSPSPADQAQLDELGIQLKKAKK